MHRITGKYEISRLSWTVRSSRGAVVRDLAVRINNISRRDFSKHSSYEKSESIRAASSTATTFDGTASFSSVDEEKRSVESYFPWRTHVHKSHTWDIQNQMSRIIVEEWLLRFDSMRHSNSSYMETDFLMGCQQAFKAAMCAIFKHKRIRDAEEALKINGLSTSNDEESRSPQSAAVARETGSSKESDDINANANADMATDANANADMATDAEKPVTEVENTFFVPELTDVFEASLGHFYNHAIDTTLRSKFIVHHEFSKVGTPYIEKYDVIFGGKRGRDFTGLVRYNSFGLIPTIKAAERTNPAMLLSDFTESNVPKPVKNLLDMRRYATVRMSVNIPLIGEFC
jgi:hypothetical protein